MPPVPELPSVDQIMASHQTNGVSKGSKGPVLQSQPFRTASQKSREGQPSWFGGAIARDANPRTSDAAIYSPIHATEPRSGSISPSINFSYPRSRALSPAPSVDDQTLVYDPNSRRMVSRNDITGRSQGVSDIAEKPKKKKKSSAPSRSGSHLAEGTVGGRTIVPVMEQTQEAGSRPEDPTSQDHATMGSSLDVEATASRTDNASTKPKKKRKKTRQSSAKTDPTIQDQPAQAVDQDFGHGTPAKQTKSEAEQSDAKQLLKQRDRGQSDLAAVSVSAAASKQRPHSLTPESKRKNQVRHTRVHSESPARSARFASSSSDQLAVRHEPPSRSVSPRKSAMKLSTQARGVSPSDDGSETSIGKGLAAQHSEDAMAARKKSARVSWDDRNTVVVGEAAQPHENESPVIPSPQAKKPWHSVVSTFSRKDNVTVAEDETMTPRPKLPLFGSVREKKMKEPEERALVRPSERTFSPESGGSASSALSTQTIDKTAAPAGTQDPASKNAANISKTREPLPAPLHSSESRESRKPFSNSSDDDFDTDVTTEAEDNPEPVLTQDTAQARLNALSTPTKVTVIPPEANKPSTVPASHASAPTSSSAEATPPGSFPGETTSIINDSQEETDSEGSGTSTPTPAAEVALAGPAMADIVEEDEETETDRFSDAYEDLEEVEGDGFLSLDAVVDSATADKVSKKKSHEKPPATTRAAKEAAETNTPATIAIPPIGKEVAPDDWENAKAYWKSLSIERRRQLEIEALSETGEDTASAKQQLKSDKTAAPSVSTERSYQIKPGTRWSESDSETDNDAEHNIDVAKHASIIASNQSHVSDDTKPQLRQSMRQSMRSDTSKSAPQTSNEEQGGMRKSMRNGPLPAKAPASKSRSVEGSVAVPTAAAASLAASKPGMRQSLRGTRSNGDTLRPALSSAGRPASYHQAITPGLAKNHKRNVSMDDLTSGSVIKPTLRRRESDDSESSFKRKRSGSGDARQFRMSMRSSMRDPSATPDPTKRFSLRSLSPPGFRRNSFSSLPPDTMSSTGGSGRMRQSLRDRPASSASRFKMGSLKKSSGFGKKSTGGSRFADSSDEDEDGPSDFRSRFADSSEDEEPTPPRKSKGGLAKSLRNGNGVATTTINHDVKPPERTNDGDVVVPPKQVLRSNGQTSPQDGRSGRGTLELMPQNAMPRLASRRGSFMSILRRKKDTSDKISKDLGESAARKDTNLERSPEELAQLRSNSSTKAGRNWPLPGDEAMDAEKGERKKEVARPSTSGGAPRPRKSSFLRRRSTSTGMVGLGQHAASFDEPVPQMPDGLFQTEGQQPQQMKKKKFGVLRKMFGIHD